MVPEELLEADLSATAVRLYGLLLRCPVVDGAHVQSRTRLAERLHRSLDTVDRAVSALVDAGWIQVAHRFSDGQQIANAYVVMPIPTDGHEQVVSPQRSTSAAVSASVDDGPLVTGGVMPVGECAAAQDSSAPPGGGRTSAARGAALLRHGRESLTERTSSPSPPRRPHLGHSDASGASQPPQRPAQPGRAAVLGGDGPGPHLVREQARDELAVRGLPVTRAAITRRACELLGDRLSRP